MSQNNEDHEFTGVNIHLLTDDNRLQARIPNYDTHYRLYFENPQAFEEQQRVGASKITATKAHPSSSNLYNNKVMYERSQETEKLIEAYFSKLTESQ